MYRFPLVMLACSILCCGMLTIVQAALPECPPGKFYDRGRCKPCYENRVGNKNNISDFGGPCIPCPSEQLAATWTSKYRLQFRSRHPECAALSSGAPPTETTTITAPTAKQPADLDSTKKPPRIQIVTTPTSGSAAPQTPGSDMANSAPSVLSPTASAYQPPIDPLAATFGALAIVVGIAFAAWCLRRHCNLCRDGSRDLSGSRSSQSWSYWAKRILGFVGCCDKDMAPPPRDAAFPPQAGTLTAEQLKLLLPQQGVTQQPLPPQGVTPSASQQPPNSPRQVDSGVNSTFSPSFPGIYNASSSSSSSSV